MPKKRDPFLCSQPILLRTTPQLCFAVQVSNQLRLTPSSHHLPLVFEWRKELQAHSASSSSPRSLDIPIAATRILMAARQTRRFAGTLAGSPTPISFALQLDKDVWTKANRASANVKSADPNQLGLFTKLNDRSRHPSGTGQDNEIG
jgi:hypothetical protein